MAMIPRPSSISGLFYTAAEEPTIKNDYLVSFVDWLGGETGDLNSIWRNPYSQNMHKIQPFIPGNCTDLIDLFNANINKECLERVFFLYPFRPTFATMDIKDLMNFSETSKCCYLATKSELIWEAKIELLLCNVTLLSPEKCTFTSEQQFQVAFRHLQVCQKPYHFQFSYNLKKYAHLIPLAKLQEFQDNKSYRDFFDLAEFVGGDFNGTLESINPRSPQGRCLAALNLIREELNCPESFELLIREAETAAKNNHPLNKKIHIIEESNAMGPDDDCNFEQIKFFSNLQNPTKIEINEALSAFKEIQSLEIKEEAFITLITAHSLSGDVVAPFYEALPQSLKEKFKG